MNPLIQLNRQPQYLFIALLLACFAIPAMGERDKSPNHKEFNLNTIPQVRCAGEKVDIRGEGKLKFGFREILGQRFFMPVDGDLAKGIGQKICPNSGQCEVGVGLSTRRKYMANTRIGIKDPENLVGDGVRTGSCKAYLVVTGVANPPPQGDVAPGTQVKFRLFYTVTYKWNSDHKVTFFEATPAAQNTIECILQ
jgi:hypothetical protein